MTGRAAAAGVLELAAAPPASVATASTDSFPAGQWGLLWTAEGGLPRKKRATANFIVTLRHGEDPVP